jgi:hypothetical protein
MRIYRRTGHKSRETYLRKTANPSARSYSIRIISVETYTSCPPRLLFPRPLSSVCLSGTPGIFIGAASSFIGIWRIARRVEIPRSY